MVACLLALMLGCQDDDSDSAPATSTGEITGAPTAPRVWAWEVTDLPGAPPWTGLLAIVHGRVTYDGELDCFFLENEGGRYPVVWPVGTTGTPDGPGVVLPDGTVARVGDEVTGGGGYREVADDYEIPSGCRSALGGVAVYNPGEPVEVEGD